MTKRPSPTTIFAGSIAIVSLFVIAKNLLLGPTLRPPVLYHGPNPDNQIALADDGQVLGSRTNRRRSPSTAPSPTQKPLPTATPIVLPTSGPLATKIPYGIAAGGGLPFLNQADLDTYFATLKSLGTTWVRWDFDWNVIQNESATKYDWSGIDRVVATATKNGINTLGIITYAPKWARDPACATKFSCQPASSQAFGNFAGIVAARYRNTVYNWEIWNEPNYSFFWSPSPNVVKYTEILKTASIAIKAANPSAVVLTGGLSASEDDAKGNISPLTFISGLYNLKANPYFDAVSIHPYTYPASPSNLSTWNHWTDMAPIHNLMVKNGDGLKKVWSTEFGVATGGPGRPFVCNQLSGFSFGSDYMSQDAQIQMVTEAVAYYRKNASWMGPFFWYSLRDEGTTTDTPENFFGLVRHDWTPKPAFSVFQKLI